MSWGLSGKDQLGGLPPHAAQGGDGVQGRSDELQHLLEEQMQRYAERLDYESAARVRDQLQGLDRLTADQKMTLPDSSVSRDVLALAFDDRVAAVQLFQMRAGKLVGRLGYTADASGLEPGLILQRVIEEHYSQVDSVEIPPELLVQHPLPQQTLMEEWLGEQRERQSVQIHCPKTAAESRSDRTGAAQSSSEFNGATALPRASSSRGRSSRPWRRRISAAADLAGIARWSPPRRIEGYDISHIQGRQMLLPPR